MASLKRFGALFCLLSLPIGSVVHGQSVSIATDDPGLTILTGTKVAGDATATGTYQTPTTTRTLATTDAALSSGLSSIAANTTSGSVVILTGTTSASKSTTKATPGEPAPTNTRPCNGYPEFCNRKYSNITVVGAHNSPFVRAGSAAANQQLDVIHQLNDGVRFLQAQIQWPKNGTEPHFCHSTCDLLDAGPITEWLTTVKDWVADHPYDVVTVLLGNGNYSRPEKYVPYIEKTGILRYVYTPPKIPMARDDWPTLAEMIMRGQRIVMYLDYDTNQTAFPWLMDEFSQMWETPFDPLDPEFPCNVQRPPDLSPEDIRKRMYIMNHNLNVEVSLLGSSIVVPAVTQLNVTNGAYGNGSLGMAANNCRDEWDYPPSVLNTDYYNIGSYPGSVFEVAAKMNNVTYVNGTCCGSVNAAPRVEMTGTLVGAGLMWSMFWVLLA
ncbi:PI-PLC X domain-containing protein 1 [Podospora conica]|nr:PI-PLC X domain-containing protein 1 [Schizothecium conicum]